MKEYQFNFKELIPNFLPNKDYLFQHHLRSYNYLLKNKIQQIMFAKVNNIIRSEVKTNFYIKYKNIRILKPEITERFIRRNLYPMECRLRDFTYAGTIEVDIEVFYEDDNENFCRFIPKIAIGQIPIMIGSDFCWTNNMTDQQKSKVLECSQDPQGYFIIKGVEKVILMQEQLCRNKILVEEDSKTKLLMASCASSTLETKSKIAVIIKNNKLYLKTSSFTELVPLFLILKAVGINNDKKIINLINPFLNEDEQKKNLQQFQNLIYMSFAHLAQNRIVNQDDALEYLASKIKYLFKEQKQRGLQQKVDEVQNILSKIILPHISADNLNYTHKINFFGLMTRRLLREYLKLDNFQEEDVDIRNDRDYLANKRIECAGDMLSLLFEDLFKRFNYEIKKDLDKQLLRKKNIQNFKDNFENIFRLMCSTNIITNGLISAISSGNWSIKRFKLDRKGVTQVMNRINYYGSVGMLTRMESHIEKSRKVSGPRSLQCSHWGFICPVDTPDGENCGLVKNLALLAKITTEIEDYQILLELDEIGLIELGIFNIIQMNHDQNLWVVVMNGKIIGGVNNYQNFVQKFRHLRRIGQINKFVSIFENKLDRVIDIWTDAGRMVRPLINYKIFCKEFQKFKQIIDSYDNNIPSINIIEDLQNIGIIEYLDVNELNNCNIVFSTQQVNKDTTHIEFSLDIILGVLAGMIPYPHHNQSPRNTYQCAMGKQSLGVLGYNQQHRIDTVMYQLVYPQKPLTRTKTLEMTGYENQPAGQNATIAIMSYSGYDIEDAVVISRSSIERGFGRAFVKKKKVINFERGLRTHGDNLVATEQNKDGIVKVADKLKKGDILVNKYTNKDENEVIPRPVRFNGKYNTSVDRILLTSSGENYLLVKMRLSQIRIPEIGDKFSSRHGQKGVMGLKISSVDLPFSENGWTPDLIMNPHGFPSRMTVGKLLELLSSKASSLTGQLYFGTAFEDKEICDKCKSPCNCKNVAIKMGEILLEYGYNYQGSDTLISGTTGEYIKGYIFSGPVYYQRLKHMVSDKIHARASGKKTFLTRQPLEGRAKEGGLRLGEMERDCLLAYGASQILLERFMISSDQYECPICTNCGQITCLGKCIKGGAQIKKIRMPYPTKLLLQELISMNIQPKIKLKCEQLINNMALGNKMKRIDFLKIVPEKMKEASYLGLGLSLIFTVLLILMILNQLSGLFSNRIESQLLIDHMKDDKDLEVILDIIFPNYPCAMMSLDKMDVLHSHIMDVEESLVKNRIDQKQKILGRYKNNDTINTIERMNIIKDQVQNNEGCRLKGNFSIKLVPGNFHIAMHNYVKEFQMLSQQGIYYPDYSHQIKKLQFGYLDNKTSKKIIRDFSLQTLHTLNNVKQQNLLKTLGYPHGIIHKLNIVPSKFEYPNKEVYEMYQYTAQTLKIYNGSLRVTFEFDIENFYMNYKLKGPNYTHALIQILSIIGGFYTVVLVLKLFIEDGVLNLAFKKRLGKLE